MLLSKQRHLLLKCCNTSKINSNTAIAVPHFAVHKQKQHFHLDAICFQQQDAKNDAEELAEQSSTPRSSFRQSYQKLEIHYPKNDEKRTQFLKEQFKPIEQQLQQQYSATAAATATTESSSSTDRVFKFDVGEDVSGKTFFCYKDAEVGRIDLDSHFYHIHKQVIGERPEHTIASTPIIKAIQSKRRSTHHHHHHNNNSDNNQLNNNNSSSQKRLVLHGTSGLGKDAYLFASQNMDVILVERDPLIHKLLQISYEQGLTQPVIANTLGHFKQIINQDIVQYLQQVVAATMKKNQETQVVEQQQERPDVIFLDPIYHAKQKVTSTAVRSRVNFYQQASGERMNAFQQHRRAEKYVKRDYYYTRLRDTLAPWQSNSFTSKQELTDMLTLSLQVAKDKVVLALPLRTVSPLLGDDLNAMVQEYLVESRKDMYMKYFVYDAAAFQSKLQN